MAIAIIIIENGELKIENFLPTLVLGLVTPVLFLKFTFVIFKKLLLN
jgi:hypothetical protein